MCTSLSPLIFFAPSPLASIIDRRLMTPFLVSSDHLALFFNEPSAHTPVPILGQPRNIAAIKASAATGKIGDGKIWVAEVSRLVRIRTGHSHSRNNCATLIP
ncbi:MAG: hypothetical protein JHD37_06610 [Ilumatobacteraceae bacterium]|nr:hypothetical protein [Ilumatobacteraceae bacterium]